MTARTDVHAPKNLVTEDYDYLYADDNMRPGRLIGVDMDWWRSITNWAPETRDRGTHQCHHCGAHIRYFAILRHVPTGFSIAVGETCLENRFERATADFQRMRKAAELDRKEQRIKTAVNEYLETLCDRGDGLLAEILLRETPLDEAPHSLDGYALSTVRDIRGKLWKYGSISERQEAFVLKLYNEAAEKRARAAQIAAQRATEVRIPAPEGRVEVVGTVVGRKSVWSDFAGYQGGYIWKIAVKDDRGFVAWLSEPSSLSTERGDRIKLRVTLKRSDRDESFAFGKRPSNAEKIGHVDGVAEELPSSLD